MQLVHINDAAVSAIRDVDENHTMAFAADVVSLFCTFAFSFVERYSRLASRQPGSLFCHGRRAFRHNASFRPDDTRAGFCPAPHPGQSLYSLRW